MIFSTCYCLINILRNEVGEPPDRLLDSLEWRPGEESDSESSRETSSAGSSDREADKRSKSIVDECRPHQNTKQLNRLSARDKFVKSSSSDEAEISNLPGLFLFEYLEQEQSHLRKPLIDKVY
ncbi:unnamed protein product [Fraxinus pennsylvanica]|uniref:Uncharacterized protein n=1 Tax=Fraxinus pennsylvanica TaxID=56036 RepID=A0AAD2E6W1_9LAMI|nr:unnamed protein product [Fraxinus pennsylvanica]